MKERLREYIARDLLSDRNGRVIDDDANLLGSGLVDSVGMMSLVLFIEDALHVDVPPEDVTIDHFLSINTIAEYLRQRSL